MEKLTRKQFYYFMFVTMVFSMVMVYLLFVNYIDWAVIKDIYVPLYGISFLTWIMHKRLFSLVFLMSTSIGIVTEYVIHIGLNDYPNMSGAFINTSILVVGGIVGIFLQKGGERNK